MKRCLWATALAVSGTFFLGSCNKSLKDDIQSMKDQTDSLLLAGKDLHQYVDGLKDIVATGEPMFATTTFEDADGNTIKVEESYKFRSATTATQRIYKFPNGTCEVMIMRLSHPTFAELGYIQFSYDPVTKAVSYIRGRHWWDSRETNWNSQFYFLYSDAHEGLDLNIDVQKFDLTTGEVKITCTAEGNAAYTNWVSEWRVPRPGSPVKTVMSFTGKLPIIQLND